MLNTEKGALVNLLIGTILAIVAAVGMGVELYDRLCGGIDEIGLSCADFIPDVATASFALTVVAAVAGFAALVAAAKKIWKLATAIAILAFVTVSLHFIWFAPWELFGITIGKPPFAWYNGVAIGSVINYLFGALATFQMSKAAESDLPK